MGNAVIAVIPYYGETSTIQRAVKSVLHQVGARVDAVVVVNDSHPDSPDLLLDELDDERVLTFNLGLDGPRGPFFARNVALQAMPRNSIVGSLDADDMWHPRLLAKALKALGAANNAAVPTQYVTLLEGSPVVKYWNANGEYTQRPASELEVRDGIVVAEAHSVEPGKEPHFRLPMNGVFRADALKALVGLYGGQPFAWDGLLANLMLMDGKVVRMPEALYLRFQRAGSLTMAPQTSFGSAARQECDRISVAAYEVMWGIYDELRPNESPERRPEFAKRIAEYVQDLIPPARKLETADASARLKSELTQVLSLSTPVSGFISTM